MTERPHHISDTETEAAAGNDVPAAHDPDITPESDDPTVAARRRAQRVIEKATDTVAQVRAQHDDTEVAPDDPSADSRRRARHAIDRAEGAHEHVRDLAADIATTADNVADTFDRLADSRESPTDQNRDAQRARDMADGERREAQQLRQTWNRPPD